MAIHFGVTQAPHASFHNGGESAGSRQYFFRQSQRTNHGPRIEAAIAGIAPGEFRTVWAAAPNEIFRVRLPSTNGSFDILDWTPHYVWDEPTRQVLGGGRRGLTKIVGYGDLVGRWRELGMPPDLGRLISGTVHYYGKIARNPLTGVVYFGSSESVSKLWSYNPVTKQWARLADAPTANGGNGASFEWAGDTERLVMYVGDARRWCIYNPGANTWTNPFNGLGHGQHAILRYHPTHARHLLVGGTETSVRASLVTSAGVVTQVLDVPETIAMSSGSWAHAHPAGCWIVKTMGTTPKVYACWPNESLTDVTWQDLGTAPDAALSLPTLVPGYNSNTLLFVSTSGLHAWRVPTLGPVETGNATLDAGFQVNAVTAASFGALVTGFQVNAGDNATLATGYQVNAGGFNFSNVGFSISAAGSISVATGFPIQESSNQFLNTGYAVQAAGASSVATGYAVREAGLDTLDAGYEVISDLSGGSATVGVGYAVGAVGANTSSVGYAVASAGLDTLDAGYAIAAAAASSTLATGYAIRTSDPAVLSTGYAVTARVFNTLAVGFEVEGSGVPTNDLVMTLTPVLSISTRVERGVTELSMVLRPVVQVS